MNIVKVDARGRISLGQLAEDTYYKAEVDELGRIILTPVVIKPVTEVEKWSGSP